MWHMLEKLISLIFRPDIPHDELINVVYFSSSALRARAIFLVFEKIYSCLFIPNCTRNQLITYINNKAMLIAKSPEGFHFPEDYLQQQKTIDHIRILSIGLELACNGG